MKVPVEDGDYYLTQTVIAVYRAMYHLNVGTAVRSGCRHCPYGYGQNTDA
jgi:hypothetical protein